MGSFDIDMNLLGVVHTRHDIRRFLRRSLVLEIHQNTVHTLGTTNKRERRKIWLSLRGLILNVISKNSLSLKNPIMKDKQGIFFA